MSDNPYQLLPPDVPRYLLSCAVRPPAACPRDPRSAGLRYSREQKYKKTQEVKENQACCVGFRRRPFAAEAPPIGKIQPFSKIAVTCEPVEEKLVEGSCLCREVPLQTMTFTLIWG